MGGSTMTSSGTSAGSLGAFLGSGSKIMGQLHFTGPVEIDGQVEGEISAQDKLTIGEAAIVKGTIQGAEILVKGTVQGDVIASKKLILRKPARIIGNLSTPNLTIEEGVTFDGKCSMGNQTSSSSKTPSKPLDTKMPGSTSTSAVSAN